MLRFLTVIFLSGCLNYRPELKEPEIPVAWKESYSVNDAFTERNRFWELLEDPILNDLEEEALSGSFDLQIAKSRIEEARSLVSKDHAARLPRADLRAAAIQDETLLNPRSFGSPTNHLERVKQEQYSATIDFSYELDIWGKLRSKERGAQAKLKATEWEHEFVYQTLVTDVAIHYLSMRALEEQIGFLNQAVAMWGEKIDLIKCRIDAGVESHLDHSKAQLEQALVQRELEEARRNYILEQNTLAALVGKPASSWSIQAGSLPKNIPSLPSVIPSQILIRRADIQAALAHVAAGRSDVSVALKNYFPSFPLTGSLGLSSPLISHFFEWQARYWGYALNALSPLFDGGKRKADVKGAKARFTESFLSYQKTVNQAIKDVEDALSTLRSKGLQKEALSQASHAASDTFSLSEDQFQSGLISYLLVADAKNTSIAVERDLIGLKGEELIAWVRLMKAFGLQKE